jgi:hypothetical protein
MQFEANLSDDTPVVVFGVKGLQSRPFTRRFRKLALFARWAESDQAGDYTVHTVERDWMRS